jgi:heterodisulfide reductase subunit C
MCYKCISRKYRENNPIQSSFQNLKTNAKRRGKEFTLTFNEFKKFAIETNYIFGKGRSKTSFHIDRIDEILGYCITNIQILTNSENTKKYNSYLKFTLDETGKPYQFWVECNTKIITELNNDCPF